jgi:hypothetical protein
MTRSEAYELLLAAKPLITKLKNTPFRSSFSQIERQALEDIEQVLKYFAYNQELVNQAGWTHSDLEYLNQSLAYFPTKD